MLLHASAIVIQRYFRGFLTRLRTIGKLRQLQVHTSARISYALLNLVLLLNVTPRPGAAPSARICNLSGPYYRALADRVPPRHHHVPPPPAPPFHRLLFTMEPLAFTSICRLVITSSSEEFAPKSGSGNRALEVNLAEELIKTTGYPAAPLHPPPPPSSHPHRSRRHVRRHRARSSQRTSIIKT